MPEIPNGPATIEILSDENGVIKFRFASFPELLRGRNDFEGLIQSVSTHERRVNCGQWRAASQIDPEIQYHVLYCPGRLRTQDDRILAWRHGKTLLKKLIAAINRKLKREKKNLRGSWRGLKTRVGIYRNRVGGRANV